MLFHFVLLIFLLLILFLLARIIINSLYQSAFIITLNHKISLFILIFLLLPGTVIHELSHFLVATILRVPTGALSIFPTIEEGGEVRAGKLTLGKTDPFRLTIVGLAPMIVGLTLIYITGKYLFIYFPLSTINNQQLTIFFLFVKCYLLFAVSITMFSSRKDLESLIIVGPLVLLILTSLHIVGIRIFFESPLIEKTGLILTDLNRSLLTTAIINSFVFFLLNLTLLFWQKILRRKVVKKI